MYKDEEEIREAPWLYPMLTNAERRKALNKTGWNIDRHGELTENSKKRFNYDCEYQIPPEKIEPFQDRYRETVKIDTLTGEVNIDRRGDFKEKDIPKKTDVFKRIGSYIVSMVRSFFRENDAKGDYER